MVRRALLAALLALAAAGAHAQFSPGELTRFHQSIDGPRGCPSCHAAGKGVTAELCLRCHTALSQRIAAGRGLHARAEYRACERCHIEHHGRDLELVFWGERGRAGFDHAQTGFPLAGRHAQLGCASCHTAQVEEKKTGKHAKLECVGCHGPQAKHAESGGKEKPAKFDVQALCVNCHGKSDAKPVGFPQVNPNEHYAGSPCADCHKPHQPVI